MTTSVTDEVGALLARVEKLEAGQEIARLHQRYVRDLAARDWDAVAGAYTEDAVCDIRHHGVHVGREAIRAMFDAELGPVVLTKDGYILSSPDIVVADDATTASGTWTWHRFQADFRTSRGLMRVWGPWSEGSYETEYRKGDDGWKISRLWFRVHAPDHDDELTAMGNEGRVIGGGVTPPLSAEPTKD